MKNELAYWFYDTLRSDNQCLLYNGSINNEVTFPLLSIGKMNLDQQAAKMLVKKRVTYLMAECFQNIIRHASTAENKIVRSSDPGFFMSRNEKDTFYVMSGNLVKNQDIDSLKNHLDDINSLDSDSLKEKYRIILDRGEFSEKGGAGLGLIDMAKKTGNKLGYKFEPYNQNSSLFYIQTILVAQKNKKIPAEYSFNMQFPINLYQKMTENNLLMLYKGDFARESILPILKIIEDNLVKESEEELNLQKVYYILIELLQNISQHAYSVKNLKDGIVLLTKTGDIYDVFAGNLVEKNKVGAFGQYLQNISNLSKEELTKMRMERLRKERKPGERPGLGLIQLSRICSEKLDYSFQDEDDNTSFYIVKARI